jgi:hypothetical protein
MFSKFWRQGYNDKKDVNLFRCTTQYGNKQCKFQLASHSQIDYEMFVLLMR